MQSTNDRSKRYLICSPFRAGVAGKRVEGRFLDTDDYDFDDDHPFPPRPHPTLGAEEKGLHFEGSSSRLSSTFTHHLSLKIWGLAPPPRKHMLVMPSNRTDPDDIRDEICGRSNFIQHRSESTRPTGTRHSVSVQKGVFQATSFSSRGKRRS